MESDLISKKEVLELTGISYGQLYRWKRKNIIPENWFIKKSSFTGQETFFPREKMLARIDKIKEMKDDYSLDELSNFFSPNPTKIEVNTNTLLSKNIIRKDTILFCTPLLPTPDSLEFPDILNMIILDRVSGLRVSQEEKKVLLLLLQEKFDPFKNPSIELTGLTRGKEMIWLLLPLRSNPVVDKDTDILVQLDLLQIIEELKLALSNIDGV